MPLQGRTPFGDFHGRALGGGDGYTTKLAYDSQGNLEYMGKAPPGQATSEPVWQIRRLYYASSLLNDIRWADGDLDFDNVWDNRATLSYT